MKIVIQKISEAPGAKYPAAKPEEYNYGKLNPTSIPVDYTVEGILITNIEIGKSVIILREKRNGIPIEGFFRSSAVTEIGAGYFKTTNSIYKVQKILS